MAIVMIEDLYEAIKAHPDYSKWEAGVPPEQALVIKFTASEPPRGGGHSEDYDAADGSTIVVDFGIDGLVRDIEIA